MELDDLAGPEIFPTALPMVPRELVVEIADLEDARPPVSYDDGGYNIESHHIRRFKPLPPKV